MINSVDKGDVLIATENTGERSNAENKELDILNLLANQPVSILVFLRQQKVLQLGVGLVRLGSANCQLNVSYRSINFFLSTRF